MRALELGFGAFWLLLGLAVCAQSLRLGMVGPFGPASGFFPFIAGTVLTLSAAALLADRANRVPEGRVFWTGVGPGLRVAATTALMAVLIALTPWLGFLLAGCVATPAMMRLVGRAGWTITAFVGLGAPIAIHLLFTEVLNSPLPPGLLRGVL